MRLIRPLLIATLLFASAAHAGAGAGNVNRYLQVVNRAHDSVVSLEVAPAGNDAFLQALGSRPIRGGGDSTTIKLAVNRCRYDMRLKFANGRTLIYKDMDLCSGSKLVVQPLPRPVTRRGDISLIMAIKGWPRGRPDACMATVRLGPLCVGSNMARKTG